MAFRGDSTGTYTFSEGSTGSTVDLGARNNYRYINATNVYNKGKEDGESVPFITQSFSRSANSVPPLQSVGDSIEAPSGYEIVGIKSANTNVNGISFNNGVVSLGIYNQNSSKTRNITAVVELLLQSIS